MALFKCIVDNYYDGITGYRKGYVYTFPSNPDSALFVDVTASADSMPVGGTALPAHKDLEGDQHIHDPVQFKENVTFDNDVFFNNITGEAGIQNHVAWHGGTGIVSLSSPGITVTGSTEFTVHSGSANFLDMTDPEIPTIAHIHWLETTGITDLYAATNLRTWVGIDINGDVVQLEGEVTSANRRDYAIIGVLSHTDGATITQSNVIPTVATDYVGTISDMCDALQFINLEGNIYSGASATVNTIAVTAGKTFSCGRNYMNDATDPHVTAQSADASIATFFTAYSDGAGGQTIGAASVVDTTKWDDGTGTLATLDDGFWITHRLYRSTTSGSTLLVYGQEVHKGRVEALNSIPSELFVPLPGSDELILRGFITLIKGTAGLQNTEYAIFTPADKMGITTSNRRYNGFDIGVPSYKDYSFTSRGLGAGLFYVGGFYEAPSADANLTQASLTISYGTASVAKGAHPFIVAGGAGTVDTGVVGLRANFTKVQDDGTRTPSTTEVISADITTLTLNEYLEVAKCVGPVQYELYVVSGTPTAYSLDFNYGFAKYEDFGNRNFMVTDFEVTGIAGATDTSAEIILLNHNAIGWTYSAAAFVPGNGSIAEMATDYSTDDNLVNTKYFAYKRANINFPIEATGPNGILIELVATAPNTFQILNAHVGVEF